MLNLLKTRKKARPQTTVRLPVSTRPRITHWAETMASLPSRDLLRRLEDEAQLIAESLTPLDVIALREKLLTRPHATQTAALLGALERAADLAAANLPEVSGTTVMALDTSGSMLGAPIRQSALLAASAARAWNAHIICFDSGAAVRRPSNRNSVLQNAEWLEDCIAMTPTDYSALLLLLPKNVQRVVVLTDTDFWFNEPLFRQGWSQRSVSRAPWLYAVNVVSAASRLVPVAPRVIQVPGVAPLMENLFAVMEGEKPAHPALDACGLAG